METVDTRAPDPPAPGSKVDPLAPLPGSVLGAATIVAAQGALSAVGVFFAVARRPRDAGALPRSRHRCVAVPGRGACSEDSRSPRSRPHSGSSTATRWARPTAFAVEAAVHLRIPADLRVRPVPRARSASRSRSACSRSCSVPVPTRRSLPSKPAEPLAFRPIGSQAPVSCAHRARSSGDRAAAF